MEVFPLAVVTVIVAVPAPTAVTFPFSTVTTLSLEEAQVRVLSVVSLGATVAIKVSLSPLRRASVPLFSVTPEARTVTVTSHVAVLPFAVVTVMVAVPAPTAVILPFSAVATFASEVLQVRVLSVVSSGATVAIKVSLSPLRRVSVPLFSVTPEARTVTVTSHVAVLPLAVVTVIVAVPAPTAVILPFVTVATFSLEEAQERVLSVVSSGSIVAIKVSFSPLRRDSVPLFSVTPEARTVTVTSHVAVLPLAVVTVIVAVPAPTAMTVPFSTVAIFTSEVLQVRVLSVVLSGAIVAISVSLSPLMRESVVLSKVTPDAKIVVFSGPLLSDGLVVTVVLALSPLPEPTLSQLVNTVVESIIKQSSSETIDLNDFFIVIPPKKHIKFSNIIIPLSKKLLY